jgi:hypothetical protein
VATVLGGVTGAAGDAAGQWVTNHNHGTHCYNVPEMIGAGIGGGLGGAAGAGIGAAAKASGVVMSDTLLLALVNQFLSGMPGYVGTAAGWSQGEQSMSGHKCGCQ